MFYTNYYRKYKKRDGARDPIPLAFRPPLTLAAVGPNPLVCEDSRLVFGNPDELLTSRLTHSHTLTSYPPRPGKEVDLVFAIHQLRRQEAHIRRPLLLPRDKNTSSPLYTTP